MSLVAARELRNQTSDILRRVEAGEQVTITVHGRPVADLVPRVVPRRRAFSRSETAALLTNDQADPGLRDDLTLLAGDTTDDLRPLR